MNVKELMEQKGVSKVIISIYTIIFWTMCYIFVDKLSKEVRDAMTKKQPASEDIIEKSETQLNFIRQMEELKKEFSERF